MGERDCTNQRRQQKIIEEGPSPAIPKDIIQKMGQAAINAAKANNYEGARTLEFLLDESDPDNKKWYFMEMNTRVQVEHCVSEMISGVDIVKEQIRVASGQRLSVTQDDIVLRGHAIECRINAEDPSRDFMPFAGKIEGYIAPGGFGVRIDSHAYTGYTIPPYYDSMVGQLICWGVNREDASKRALRALDEYIITGMTTTIPFPKAILNNDVFISRQFNPSFIEKHY